MKGYEDAIKKIDELPGIGKRSSEVILSEIGTIQITQNKLIKLNIK